MCAGDRACASHRILIYIYIYHLFSLAPIVSALRDSSLTCITAVFVDFSWSPYERVTLSFTLETMSGCNGLYYEFA